MNNYLTFDRSYLNCIQKKLVFGDRISRIKVNPVGFKAHIMELTPFNSFVEYLIV